MFSKACEYGIKAMIYIATQSMQDNRVKIGDIAVATGTPEAFTGKILGALVKHNIVQSLTGPYGGFHIDKKRLKDITISEIVYAIDGDSIYNGCGLGLKECNASQPCPMHDKFVKVRSELKKMLNNTTVYDLAVELHSGKTLLMR